MVKIMQMIIHLILDVDSVFRNNGIITLYE